MEKFYSTLSEVYYRLFGSERLLSYEKLCLDAWQDSLSDQARDILNSQLAGSYYIQRQATGAKVCFYWRKIGTFKLFDPMAPDLHVATIFLQADNGKQMPAKIYIHRGRFFSIEFPKRPERYMEQHGMKGMSLRLAKVQTHVVL